MFSLGENTCEGSYYVLDTAMAFNKTARTHLLNANSATTVAVVESQAFHVLKLHNIKTTSDVTYLLQKHAFYILHKILHITQTRCSFELSTKKLKKKRKGCSKAIAAPAVVADR